MEPAMTEKRVNIKALIKSQLNGNQPVTSRLDTQDSTILEYLEADMMYNADNYTKVNILGVDVHVKIGEDK